MELTSGTFGGDVTIEQIYVPFTIAYTYAPIGVRLTVPYIRISAADAPILATPEGAATAPTHEGAFVDEGLGDLLASVTYYDLLKGRSIWFVDLTGRVKFGTADEEVALGTGEDDYTVQMDLARELERTTPFFSLGRKWLGDRPTFNYDDVWFGVGGIDFYVDNRRSTSLSYYHAGASASGAAGPQEATATFATRTVDDWRLSTYVLVGFSEASPDWGFGLTVSSQFDPLHHHHHYRESLK
jgi:hypothetical protein